MSSLMLSSNRKHNDRMVFLLITLCNGQIFCNKNRFNVVAKCFATNHIDTFVHTILIKMIKIQELDCKCNKHTHSHFGKQNRMIGNDKIGEKRERLKNRQIKSI